MEACDVAAKAADQSSMSFRVFVNFNYDKMAPSGINTHTPNTPVCVLHVWGRRHGWWYRMNILFG